MQMYSFNSGRYFVLAKYKNQDSHTHVRMLACEWSKAYGPQQCNWYKYTRTYKETTYL